MHHTLSLKAVLSRRRLKIINFVPEAIDIYLESSLAQHGLLPGFLNKGLLKEIIII